MNLDRAYQRVVANAGAPGVDGMTVDDLRDWLCKHDDELIASLLDGSYRPPPVRGVQIPKPGGGKRQLGIPTAVDRVVQTAILQVLNPILDPTFSESSFGFRPGRSPQQALEQASRYVAEGREWVVDMDLEKFFDRVNHDILMSRLARRIGDKRLLRLIRRFLEAGLMQHGVCIVREEGTPQGGPLSPLLANLLLDDLDRELEKRGHRFCRYADDCNIYVRSQKAGERTMASLIQWLDERLRLTVNLKKSAVAQVEQRKFLSYRLLRNGWLTLAPETIKRLKNRIREMARRKQAVPFRAVIERLDGYFDGWMGYFQQARARQRLKDLDEWVRRKLRCLKLKQLKNPATIARFLTRLGVDRIRACQLAYSGKGWWTRALSPQAHRAMSNEWFAQEGFCGLVAKYDRKTAKRENDAVKR
jgi:RNA-directed DNA polymerase